MFCKQCGTALGDNAKYCPKCGTPVVQRQTAQTVLEPPQKRTQPPEKPKKNGTKILAIILSAVLVLGACSGVFVFRDEIFSLFSGYEDVYSEVDEILQESIVCEAFRAASINERKEIVETTLNNLEAKGEIKEDSVTYSDGGYFYFNFLNGAEGIISLNDQIDNADGESISPLYYKEKSGGINKTDDYSRIPDFNGVRAPYVESDKTALIIDELGYAFNSMNFGENKKEWGKCHLQTTVEQNFTVQQFKTELSKYDFICIRCHGCFDKSINPNFAVPMIETTEKFGHDMEKYILDLSNGRVGAFYSSTAGSYILKPSFFEYYYKNNKLNGKIVWLGCCYGFKNEKLVSAFSKCGAKTVIGATESVNSLYGTRMCDAFVYYLLCGDNTDIALANAKNDKGEHDDNIPPAEFKKYVDSRAVYLFTLNEEGKKALTEVSETTEIKKGSISGKVTDESGNPIENAEVTAMATLSDTISNKKAKTDNDGYYKIECNTGNYKIKVTADGYEEYNSDEVINVEKDFDTILDTIQLKKIKKEYTESDLKEKVLAESGGNIGSWVYEDFDGNGTKEAYAVITGNHDSITECDQLEDIYFINGNGEITKMPGDFWGGLYYSKTKEYEYFVCQGKGFFAVDSGNGGSGWQTLLYSVKDGSPYELDISRAIQGFNERDGIYYTTENEFYEEGGHGYPEVELIYNSSTQQFSKGNRIISEENNTISDWKSAYIEVLSNLNNSSARFTTAYIDEDDIQS